MEHPLLGDLSDLSLEQLTEKISDINKRLSWAHRTNNAMIPQLLMLLESYQNQFNTLQKAQWDKERDKGSDYLDKIDIT